MPVLEVSERVNGIREYPFNHYWFTNGVFAVYGHSTNTYINNGPFFKKKNII